MIIPGGEPLSIARGPIDLPPMTLSWVFKRWSTSGLIVDQRLDWGEGPKTYRNIVVKPDAKGLYRVRAGGSEVVLRRESEDRYDAAIVEGR